MDIFRYIKLFKINRFPFRRFCHLIYNILPFYIECSICNWKGSKYFRGYCPICFSQARHRLLGYIIKLFHITSQKNILFIGPGPSETILTIFKYNAKLLDIIQRDFTDIVIDITDDNIELNNFDIIIMWHVLEHIEEDKKAVKNVFNMLNSGGIFLFSVPIYPPGNIKTYIPKFSNIDEKTAQTGHPDHFICCGEDYPDRFSDIGFKTLETYSVRDFNEDIISKYNLNTDHFAWVYIK